MKFQTKIRKKRTEIMHILRALKIIFFHFFLYLNKSQAFSLVWFPEKIFPKFFVIILVSQSVSQSVFSKQIDVNIQSQSQKKINSN